MVTFFLVPEVSEHACGSVDEAKRCQLGYDEGIRNHEIEQADLIGFKDPWEQDGGGDESQDYTYIRVNGACDGLFLNDAQV